MRSTCFHLVVFLLLTGLRPVVAAPSNDGALSSPVPIEFFYETGCGECERVKQEVLPELERRYAGYYRLQLWDVEAETNYLRLVTYQTRFGVRDNEPVCLVVDERDLLSGFARIQADLFATLDRAIARRLAAAPPPAPAPAPATGAREALRQHVRGFTLLGIVAAAGVDSLNPCAIATLVFFLSLLSVAHIGTRRMLLAGGAFVVGSYLTYFLLGFGLLRALSWIESLRVVRRALDAVVIVLLLGFAALSFRDAWRYRRSGRPDDVTVKLPPRLQARIHAIMKQGLQRRNLLLGGFGIGVAVTLLESVCTGQVYVPALVLMIRSGEDTGRCLAYLALYNAIFVMPLAILLGLTCWGLRTPRLVEWSRKNVVFSKVLLGVCFLAMTFLMLVLMR